MPPASQPELLAAGRGLLARAGEQVVRAVAAERIPEYWHIGQVILAVEQYGADRAAYGSRLLKGLAAELPPQFGSEFSGRQLARYRQFYRTFLFASAVRTQWSWTHYKTILRL